MFVYFNWNNGDILAAAFSEPEKGATYVIGKIEEYIGIRKKTPDIKMSKKRKKEPYLQNVENLRQMVQAYVPEQPIYGGGGAGQAHPYIERPLWQAVQPEDQALAVPAVPAPPPPVPAFENFIIQAQQPAYPPDPNDYQEPDDYPNEDEPMPHKKAKKRSLANAEAPEFTALMKHLEIANKEKTVENARKAIALYDEYVKFVLGTEPLLHAFQEIKVDDGSF